MAKALPSALGASRAFVRVLIPTNLVFGGLILALLVASLIAEEWVARGLGMHTGDAALIQWARAVMVIGIASVACAHLVLTRLLAIVETVRLGDPFVVVNGARLRTMAWALLGLEVLHLAVGAVAAGAFSGTRLALDWSFSVVPWVAALLLFVLAQVFEDGALMRDDLKGIV